jgi:hypothetical protein
MGRRIEGKQKEEYPHNKDPFCKIDKDCLNNNQ